MFRTKIYGLIVVLSPDRTKFTFHFIADKRAAQSAYSPADNGSFSPFSTLMTNDAPNSRSGHCSHDRSLLSSGTTGYYQQYSQQAYAVFHKQVSSFHNLIIINFLHLGQLFGKKHPFYLEHHTSRF